MSCKFKIGDVIVGIDEASIYALTKKGWKGRVLRVLFESDERDDGYGNADILVESFDFSDEMGRLIRGPHRVESRYFTLLERKSKKRSFKNSLIS